MPGPHIVKSFDRDLDRLASMLATMGQLAVSRLEVMIRVLADLDASGAEDYFHGDDTIDGLEREIDSFTLRLLALREPKASDLRVIIAAQKIAAEIERIGDYCSSLMRQVQKLKGASVAAFLPLVSRMAQACREQLMLVMEAFAELDADKAVRVWRADDVLDDLYNQFIVKLQAEMDGEGNQVAYGALLLIARCLERIGDHITNTAEHVHFQVAGEKIPGA